MTRKAQEVLDFNLYLGPDDQWHSHPIFKPLEQCGCETGCKAQPGRVCVLSGFLVPDEQSGGLMQGAKE